MSSLRALIPHAVTASRLVIVAATYPAAFQRQAFWVLALVLLAVATDILDGLLARRWGVESTFGANLDSAIDFVFYASLVVWVWIFDASVIRTIAIPAVIFTALYITTLALAKARRGAMGFHNVWTRGAATVGVVLALWTMLWGWHEAFLWVLLVALTIDIGQRLAKILRTPANPRAAAREPAER